MTINNGQPAAAAGARPATEEILGRPVDVRRATPELVELLRRFFTAKSHNRIEPTMEHFHRDRAAYIDSTLGWGSAGWQAINDGLGHLMQIWPESACSYPTRILGDTRSAAVFFTDTPEMFGHELRILGMIDFEEDRIVRWVDYWPGRAFPLGDLAVQRAPDESYPADLALPMAASEGTGALRTVAERLTTAFTKGDAARVAALCTDDAVLEDLGLRTSVIGRIGIAAYLERAIGRLPYGTGSGQAIRHVVGAAGAGAYEWAAGSGPVRGGVSALELDSRNRVERLSISWDTSQVDRAAMTAMLTDLVDE